MKITFLGDIMCEPSVLQGAKQKDGSYNFDYLFAGTKGLFAETDYLVGNLETPLTADPADYCDDYADFGAPDSIAEAVKKAGFDLISTANNHTFDRKYEGLVHTIEVMDKLGLAHTGTYLPGSDRPEAYYFQLDGAKIAVIAYTYSTNFKASGKGCLAEGEYAGTVNLLRPQAETVFLPSTSRGIKPIDKFLKKFVKSYEKRGRIKHKLGLVHAYPRPDHNLNKETMAPYVEQFQSDIRKAKENADFVIFYPHTGGQFDPHPGIFTEYVVEKAVEAGADAVIASHAHTVQKLEYHGPVPCAYSLGNFNMDMDSGLAVPEALPGYGLAMHLYMEGKTLKKVTFSILAARRVGKGVAPTPVDELYPTLSEKEQAKLKKDVRQIYETALRRPLTGEFIRREYDVTE